MKKLIMSLFLVLVILVSVGVVNADTPGSVNVCCQASDNEEYYGESGPDCHSDCNWVTRNDNCGVDKPMGSTCPSFMEGNTISCVYNDQTVFHYTSDGCLPGCDNGEVEVSCDGGYNICCPSSEYSCNEGSCYLPGNGGGSPRLCVDNDFDSSKSYYSTGHGSDVYPPDLLVKSTVSDDGDIIQDFCTGSNSIKENYCYDIERHVYVASGRSNEHVFAEYKSFDCNDVNSGGVYSPGSNTGAVCSDGRCVCPSGEVWLSNGKCGGSCSSDIASGNTVDVVSSGSRKAVIDNTGKLLLTGEVRELQSSTSIENNAGFVISSRGQAVAGFTSGGDVLLKGTKNEHYGSMGDFENDNGFFVVHNNDIKFYINQYGDLYTVSCIASNLGTI